MNKVIALVGMTGCGKTEVADFLKEKGFPVVRFGDVTDDEIKKRGLVLNEENEKMVREGLRRDEGMAIYAKLNAPRIDKALEKNTVIADGLYSFEEYLFLNDYYGDKLVLIAVYASPKTRYKRLASRKVRPLNEDEACSRDFSEIENLNKGGPIVMADYNIINEGSVEELRANVEKIMKELK